MDDNLMRYDGDSPWKQGIEDFFEYFMLFFFPEIERHIDWSKKPESLEQELLQLSREAKMGKRIADKLFKVHMKDGKYVHLFIHVEVQGQHDPAFTQRMFWYNVRIQLKYNHPVISLAVLTDGNPNWRPDKYRVEAYGWHMEMKFLTAKVIDHRNKKKALLDSDNPFSMVMLAYLERLDTEDDIDERYRQKLYLSRYLLERGWGKEKIVSLLRFIEWVLVLPMDLELEYVNELYDQEKSMFLCSLERREMKAVADGHERGHQKGLEEGIEQGIEQGHRDGEIDLLLEQLAVKFESVPEDLRDRVKSADSHEIHAWGRSLLSADTLNEVFSERESVK